MFKGRIQNLFFAMGLSLFSVNFFGLGAISATTIESAFPIARPVPNRPAVKTAEAAPSTLTCRSLLGKLSQSIKNVRDKINQHPVNVYLGRAEFHLSTAALKVFEDAYQARDQEQWKPSAAQIEILKNEKVLPLFERYQASRKFVQALNHWRMVNARADFPSARKGFTKLWDAWRILIPFAPAKPQARVNSIYAQLIKDPENYQPNPQAIRFFPRWYKPLPQFYSDARILEKAKLEKNFEKLRTELIQNPQLKAQISRLRIGKFAAKWSLIGAVTLINALGFQNIKASESWDANSPYGMSNEDNKTELVFSDPFPHIAIRINGIFYNYGQGDIHRLNFAEMKAVGFGPEASGSQVRVQLNLTPDQTRDLISSLEEGIDNFYPLLPPWNTSVGEVNHQLSQTLGLNIPPVINQSQSLTLAYLKMLKRTGDPRIGSIIFAARDDHPTRTKVKAVVSSAMEAAFFTSYAKSTLITTLAWQKYGRSISRDDVREFVKTLQFFEFWKK